MGLIVKGEWVDQWYSTKASKGNFERQESRFRHSVSSEKDSLYQPESGRYHLYVSLACPWAHRTMVFRALKGLTDHIDVSVVHPDMLSDGWTFETDGNGATGDENQPDQCGDDKSPVGNLSRQEEPRHPSRREQSAAA